MRRVLRWGGYAIGALTLVEVGQQVSLGGTLLLAIAGMWLIAAVAPESS